MKVTAIDEAIAARAQKAHIRCPKCREHETTWNATGGLGCAACGLKLTPPKHDPSPNYEGAAWAHRTNHWDAYDATGRLERRLRADDEKLDDAIATRGRPIEIEDVRRIFAGGVSDKIGAAEQEILGALALMLWGKNPTLGRSWYRRDPKRSPFGSLGQVLRFHHGDLGLGALRLELAETRYGAPADLEIPEWLATQFFEADVADVERHRFAREIRRVGGMRSGHIHAKGSSQNGCTGGAKNLDAIQLGIAVELRIRDSGVHPADVALLAFMHRDTKPDRRGAVLRALREEGALAHDAPKNVVDAAWNEHRHRIGKRLSRATDALEKALRRLAPNALDDSGQPREPGDVSLLRPAEDEPRHHVDVRPLVALMPIGPAMGVA